MRHGFQQVTIFECPRFMFARIAHKVAFSDPVIQDLVPLYSSGKPRPAPPAQTGLLQLINHLRSLQLLDTTLPGFIPPDFEIPFDLPRGTLEFLDTAWCRSKRHRPSRVKNPKI